MWGLQRVQSRTVYGINPEYVLKRLKMSEYVEYKYDWIYAGIYLKKQIVSNAVHSIRSLYKLLGSYWDRRI